MTDVLTVAEMHARFAGEWILVENPQTDQAFAVQAGVVLAHSKDRDEVYRQAVLLRPRRFAVVYTGTLPPDTEVAL